MSWRDVGTGGSGGAGILKWKPGERKMLHVLFKPGEEPHSFRQHYFREINKGGTCIGAGCPACEADKKRQPSLRHVFRAYDFQEKAILHWICSDTTAAAIKDQMELAGGNLDAVDLAVKRTGDGMATVYLISALPTRFKASMAPETDWPTLEEPVRESTYEDLQAMAAGVDPSTEFDPEKIEKQAARTVQRPLEKPVAAADPWESNVDEPQDETPAPQDETAAPWEDTPAPAPETSPAVDRNDLMKKVLQKYSTSPKLKKAGQKEKFLQHFAPGKKTISQASVPQLQEMLKALS